ncbi:hypothetical protein PSEUBRA_001752 [Kalmanozyma brasiliensis GHG001]|uniref:Uncharacterized protein n=1 Tax=Kalmanozyma brasiliensis (strain GHG001) TaxID=1365824 RepID=V5EDY3_KALBG|nr:uncharacterized protein PSEUBRA_001752 [Kalmanozyma brasiliensis GHG001]EST08676.1 hypothetical protein PSEUBRA_001752 [Kalmanozyma brasiliensis GHG001]
MEKTFNDPAQSQQFSSDAERQKANEQRAQQGEPQIPGAAGRESVPTKDPKEFDVRGGPGSMGNKPVQDPVI